MKQKNKSCIFLDFKKLLLCAFCEKSVDYDALFVTV